METGPDLDLTQEAGKNPEMKKVLKEFLQTEKGRKKNQEATDLKDTDMITTDKGATGTKDMGSTMRLSGQRRSEGADLLHQSPEEVGRPTQPEGSDPSLISSSFKVTVLRHFRISGAPAIWLASL